MWLNLSEGGELVAIRRGGLNFLLRERKAEVGRSELFCRESFSKSALCLLRNPGDRPAEGRPTGQSSLKTSAGRG